MNAQFQLAQRLRRGNDTEALRWFRKAAEQNHTKAMLQLGAMLHDTER